LSRRRRYVSVALGLVTLLSLGFVVAVAARSRPGGFGEEPLFELDTTFDIDVGNLFGWILIVLAVLGAILLVFAIKEVRPRRQERKRSYASVVLGVLVFLLILRFLQPVAENFVADPGGAGEAAASGESATTGGSAAAWLFSLLVAAVIAAALTRVGLAVRLADDPFDEPAPEPAGPRPMPGRRLAPAALALGTDPRSRILNAYERFERSAADRGVARKVTETAQRHARRATAELGLDHKNVSRLMDRYSRTRFGHGPVSVADAEEAEAMSVNLCQALEMAR
jgi:hypothetical protein